MAVRATGTVTGSVPIHLTLGARMNCFDQYREQSATGGVPPAADADQAAQILSIDTGSAERVSVYLHPEDARLLRQGRVDDGADANTRIRAMLALYRADARVRARVDELARSTPRRNRRVSDRKPRN